MLTRLALFVLTLTCSLAAQGQVNRGSLLDSLKADFADSLKLPPDSAKALLGDSAIKKWDKLDKAKGFGVDSLSNLPELPDKTDGLPAKLPDAPETEKLLEERPAVPEGLETGQIPDKLNADLPDAEGEIADKQAELDAKAADLESRQAEAEALRRKSEGISEEARKYADVPQEAPKTYAEKKALVEERIRQKARVMEVKARVEHPEYFVKPTVWQKLAKKKLFRSAFFEPNLSFVPGDPINVGFAPVIGRNLGRRAALAVGPVYQFAYQVDGRRSAHLYGGRLLGRYQPFDKLPFLQAEYETLNAEDRFGQNSQRAANDALPRKWFPAPMVGVGKSFPLGKDGAATLALLYNLNGEASPVRDSRFVFRFGLRLQGQSQEESYK